MKKPTKRQLHLRNPVAKHSTSSGSGYHKDKKAASKRGWTEDDIEQYRSWGYPEWQIEEIMDESDQDL